VLSVSRKSRRNQWRTRRYSLAMVKLGRLQNLVGFLDRRLTELAIDAAGVIDQFEQFRPGMLGSAQRLTATPVVLVREVLREGCSSPADTKAPAFKGGRFVSETGQVFAGFQHGFLVWA